MRSGRFDRGNISRGSLKLYRFNATRSCSSEGVSRRSASGRQRLFGDERVASGRTEPSERNA